MADAYTGAGALLIDQTAYDLAVYHALRPLLYFDQVADVQSTRQSFNGAAVKFTIVNDLSVATTALNESTDISAVALSEFTAGNSIGIWPLWICPVRMVGPRHRSNHGLGFPVQATPSRGLMFNVGVYGAQFIWWDRVMGTDKHFLVWRAARLDVLRAISSA